MTKLVRRVFFMWMALCGTCAFAQRASSPMQSMAETQYDWLYNELMKGHVLHKADVLRIFGIHGEGTPGLHLGAKPATRKAVYFTMYAFPASSLPKDGWIGRFELSIDDGTDNVGSVNLYPRDDVCINADAFIRRFALLERWSEKNSAGPLIRAEYAKEIKDSIFDLDVRYERSRRDGAPACIYSANAYTNNGST